MLKHLAQSWLALQCQMIPNVMGGMAAFGLKEGDKLKSTACWPENYVINHDLLAAAELAVSRKAPVVSGKSSEKDKSETENIIIACPLHQSGTFYGVVSIELTATQGQQAAVIQLLHWGAAWLDLLLANNDGAALHLSSRQSPMLISALKCEQVEASATCAANELMTQLSCVRVSFGSLNKKKIKLLALSHSASYEPRANIIHNIEKAMDEAVTHQRTVVYPAFESGAGEFSNHSILSKTEENESVCTVPLVSAGHIIGAISFERSVDASFSKADVSQCEEMARLLGPIIDMKLRLERSVIAIAKEEFFSAPIKRIVGPQGMQFKLVLLFVLGLIGVLGLVNGEFRISATANLEAKVQRVAVAPFDGYINKAFVRAGEIIQENDVLAELDDRELRLEQRKLISQRDEMAKQYNKALAGLDHAQARIYQTQVSQVKAKLALLDEQLVRTKIIAPFDGVVISGDLSQSLGTPVERGTLLFEIAPLNEYRVVLQVDERDIAYIEAGQMGLLTLSAMPGTQFPLTVEKVSSVYQQDESKALFRVEASIADLQNTPSLRPGMKGIGKIEVGERSYLWQWTRRMTGWLQLHLWAWLP